MLMMVTSPCLRIIFVTLTVVTLSTKLIHSSEQWNSNEQLGTTTNVKVSVPLHELPDTFSNEKLPDAVSKTNVCYPLIGCFLGLPTDTRALDSSELGTVFGISRRTGEKVISYGAINNCLTNHDTTCEVYPFDLNELLSTNFDPKLRTIIIIGGWRSGTFSEWQQEMRDKWLKLENVNVILVSWPKGNSGHYDLAVANSRTVARQVAVLLYYLAKLHGEDIKNEQFLNKIQLIGHSLGAHIAGFVGQDLAGKVNRITGLDPAGPFFTAHTDFKLDRSDAKLVAALHTNGGIGFSLVKPQYGINELVGHLDFFGNDGKHQTHCKDDLWGCSHQAAHEYYVTLLDHEQYIRALMNASRGKWHRLFAYRGNNYEDFKNGKSLSRDCPMTTLDEIELTSSDFNKCSAPLDFTASAEDYIRELKDDYEIDLNSENRFYFFTFHTSPYLNNHNLLKVMLEKRSDLNFDLTAAQIKQCNVEIEIKNESENAIKYKLKDYGLIEQEQHYELLIPFIAQEMSSKYELLNLDYHDFFVHNTQNLISGLKKILPPSLTIKGSKILPKYSPSSNESSSATNESTKRRGFVTWLHDFLFPPARNDDKSINNKPDLSMYVCDLRVEGIFVQPFKRLSRSVLSAYTLDSQSKEFPDLCIVDGDANDVTNVARDEIKSKFKPPSKIASANDNDKHDSKWRQSIKGNANKDAVVNLDAVIVGPRDIL